VVTSDVELIRGGYEAWNRRDIDAVVQVLDPDIEWRGYTHIPESGVMEGREQVRTWLERFLEAWEELEIQVTDLIDSGEQTIALVRFRALGRESGVRVDGGTDAHVWTVRDGKAAAVTLYQGTHEAFEAAGLQR
jgi:ketosteroid isomerase-like protein